MVMTVLGNTQEVRPKIVAAPPGARELKSDESILKKYSLDQLRSFLAARRNKSATDSSPPDVRGVSSGYIVDTITYRQKSLYGTDRRKDFNEIRDLKQLSAANSVAIMVKAEHYKENAASIELIGRTLGEEANLCSGQHYFAQPSVGYCTAFVIGTDVVATAGHCVPAASDMTSTRIAFGFRAESSAAGLKVGTTIPKDDVYTPVKVLSRTEEPAGVDYAVIQVDRPIKNHMRLDVAPDTAVAVGDEVYVIGHPSGLPMKLADRAYVRSISERGYFVSNLDTFGGNSGSPVFLAGTLTVQGILVRGDTDFVPKDTCNVAFVCPTGASGCRGEDSTLSRYLTASVPKALANPAAEPFSKTFSSGPVLSGSRKSFSQEYVVTSEPAPPGFKIANFSATLSGDRACNAWSTCKVSVEGDRVVFRFTLQGHDEWGNSGQAQSTGNLIVTYAPTS